MADTPLPPSTSPRVPKPRGHSNPRWFGGLTGPELLFLKEVFGHPELTPAEVGRKHWPNLRFPEQKARNIYRRLLQCRDIGAILLEFGPDMRVVINRLGELVASDDDRVALAAVKTYLDTVKSAQPQIVQQNVNVQVQAERQAAREFKARATPEELAAERLRLHEEYMKQQEESSGPGPAPEPDSTD